MAPHSSTLAWKIPWTEEPGRLQSMGSHRVGHDWATSLSLFTFMHWRRKWQPTPAFLPGESQGRRSLLGCHLWGRAVRHDWSDLAAAAFQILRDDAVEMLHSIGQQIWKTQQWSQYWKRLVFIPVSEKGNAKEHSNYRTTALISHASKVMLKILQGRLQQYMNWELPDIQAGFRKGRETRDQIANSCSITEKAREFQKNIYFCFIDYAKAFDCVDHNCGKLLKRWEYQTSLPSSWETCMWVKKQQLEPYMEQRTGSNLGKE